MASTDINTILKNNHLSITEGRVKILSFFQKSKRALSHADIEKETGPALDRVTIYRTLQSFLDKGLIHTIPTDDNSIQYALCKAHCSEGHHHDNHVHFICKKCGTTYCLNDVQVPNVTLPRGFSGEQAEMVVKGICEKCQR